MSHTGFFLRQEKPNHIVDILEQISAYKMAYYDKS